MLSKYELKLQGISVNTFDDLQNTMYPVIYAGDAPNITGGFNSSVSRLCRESNSLNENLVRGKILLCDGFGVAAEQVRSGAVGLLLRTNIKPTDYQRIFALPTTVITDQDGARVRTYIRSTRYIIFNY